MKNTRLLYAIGDIDETYVTEAASRKRHLLWPYLTAAAACVAVVALCATTLFRPSQGNTPSDSVTPSIQSQLPIIPLSQTSHSGMGREAYLAPSFDHLRFHNPWSEEQDIRTLPVYDNSARAEWYADVEFTYSEEEIQAMQQEALRVAALLGMDTSGLIFEESLYDGQELSDGHYRIEVDGSRLQIHIQMEQDPFGSSADYDTLYTTAKNLLEEYRAVIDMENPQLDIGLGDYDVYGEPCWSVHFFDAVEDPTEALMNYHFRQGTFFYSSYDQEFSISFYRHDLSTVMGAYPLITVQQAKEALAEGYYVSSCFEPYTGTETICRVELVYRTAPWDTVFVPYYKFYIEETDPEPIAAQLGLKSYATCYVPAVERQYLDGLPQWDGSINN